MALITLTGINGNVNIAGTDVPVSEFEITIRRGTIIQSRLNKYSDLQKAGKVSVFGSVTLTDISGLQIARLLNTTVTSPVYLGKPTTFTLYGEATSELYTVKLQAANCFFTEALTSFRDADTFIGNQLLFEMENPDQDLSLYYTEGWATQTEIHTTDSFIYTITKTKTHTTDSDIKGTLTKTHTTNTYIKPEDMMPNITGTVTIPAENTYVTVTHNAGSLPTMYIISPYGQVGSWYITDKTINSFKLNMTEAQPTSVDIGWGIVY